MTGCFCLLTSYPCPKIFSISGHKVIAANSPSNGLLAGRSPDIWVTDPVKLENSVELQMIDAPSVALFDSPRGGTLAPAGRTPWPRG